MDVEGCHLSTCKVIVCTFRDGSRNVEGEGHIVCRPIGSNLLVVRALTKAVHGGT